jgi:rfaE bifunctional protein kinase chain/domain/rfaE bifunctional protein nucleotidyltransferase chain/domain
MKKDINFLNKYKHKIISNKNYNKFIGSYPRKKKVIMCHGVFDVVHPGHIRHFMYAKNKADILLVSLTSDKHINKGNYRPHVPENLRAFNLAALDVVDFVIIDSDKEPIKNIKKIKPEYFAKGFEYQNYKKNLKTSSEYQTINTYGGKVIFTPGDVVYSSSKIINSSLPNISYEKLHNLMDTEKVTFNDLKKTIKSFSKVSVHVVGDTIVDSYTNTVPIGGPVKYPYLSLLNISKTNYIGGAAIVASHLAFTGCKTIFTSVVGDDKNAKFVKDKLKKNKVKFNLIIDKNRPTTNKNTIVAKNQKLLKLDTLDNTPISDEISELIKKKISNTKTNAVIFSDFRHGIFNKNSITEYANKIPKKTFKVADSQVASRWGNILDFLKFDLITPNEREARFSLGDQDSSIRPLATELFKKSKCKLLILKLAEKGTLTYRKKDWNQTDSFYVLDSLVTNLVDPVGAGDALIAYATLSMVVSKNHAISSIISSIAASLACEKEGNIPIKISEMMNRINEIEKKINYK